MLATNSRLTKISISYSGITRDGCEKLVGGLAIGYGIPLAQLDLSGNPIEDKGMIALAEFLISIELVVRFTEMFDRQFSPFVPGG